MDYTRYCSLTYNGVLLDDVVPGYTTINVEGRGLTSQILNNVIVPGYHGSRTIERQYPPKEIKIHFLLQAENDKLYRERLNALNTLLQSNGAVPFSFGDEAGTRYGEISEYEDPPYDRNQGVGAFTIYCADPFKYGIDKSSTGTSSVSVDGWIKPSNIIVTLAGVSTVVSVLDNVSGATLSVSDSFESGDIVTFDISNNKVLKNETNITGNINFKISTFKGFKFLENPELNIEPVTSGAKIEFKEVAL